MPQSNEGYVAVAGRLDRGALSQADAREYEALPMKWQVNKLIAFGLVAAVFTAARHFG